MSESIANIGSVLEDRVRIGASGQADATAVTISATDLAITPQASGSIVYGALVSNGHAGRGCLHARGGAH
jgi:hypothetical protein